MSIIPYILATFSIISNTFTPASTPKTTTNISSSSDPNHHFKEGLLINEAQSLLKDKKMIGAMDYARFEADAKVFGLEKSAQYLDFFKQRTFQHYYCDGKQSNHCDKFMIALGFRFVPWMESQLRGNPTAGARSNKLKDDLKDFATLLENTATSTAYRSFEAMFKHLCKSKLRLAKEGISKAFDIDIDCVIVIPSEVKTIDEEIKRARECQRLKKGYY